MNADSTKSVPNVTGAILAGGQGARCGGVDKGMLMLHHRPLIENMLLQLEPQVDQILISANRHHEFYARYGHPVFSDETAGFEGPMAGVSACLRKARTEWVLFVPVDAVQLPSNFAQRMCEAAHQQSASTVAAHDGTSIIPVACLIRRKLHHDLQESFLAGHRSLRDWLRQQHAAELHFAEHPRAYWSLNTLDELQALHTNLITHSQS